MYGYFFRGHAALIAEILSPIHRRVAVQDFAPMPGPWYTDAIVVTRDGREVADDCDNIFAVSRFSQKAQHALLRIVGIDPFKSRWIAIHLVQSFLLFVSLIYVRHPALEVVVGVMLEQVPFQTLIVPPLSPLSELTTHKQQL